MPPAKPDRPSLCAVVGEEKVALLDSGASSAHARECLEQLAVFGVANPDFTILTHAHWDHVFGATEIGAPVIAQKLTAEKLIEMATRDWSDEGLDAQVALGLENEKSTKAIRVEVPSPREVRIAQAEITFEDSYLLDLGSVRCEIRHIGGDHAADSSVIFVEPDRVFFLGDSLCSDFYTSRPRYSVEKLGPLLDKVEEFEADHFIEGHEEKVISPGDFQEEVALMRSAIEIVSESGPDRQAALSVFQRNHGQDPDEDMAFYLRALCENEPN
ncbi:MAG: MBL fold metallo-hydrolase [Akkermansiaceae bacterium]